MHLRSKRVTATALAAGLAVLTVAPGAVAQDAPLAEGTSVVVLMPSTTNNYLAEWVRGANDEAARQGISLTVIENNFDQAEQNVQAQQQLAAGTPPDAYVWWPADNNAGVATLQALAATGVPVVQTNQLPAEAAAGSWVAYAGVNDVLNGQVAGELLVEARDKLVEEGTLTLHSDGGNAIVVKFIAGYAAADDRMTGFDSVAGPAGITILAEEPAGFDAQTGYTAAQGLITANRDAGIDMVYAHNDALAVGVIQALEEAGYTPGTDIAVVGGTCHGQLGALEDGKQYGTGLQAAFLEGLFTINVVARYLANPTVAEGEYNAPADPDAFPELPAEISTYNFIPNPPVLGTDLDSTSLWGFPLRDLCTF
jgi:ABC-type sugar transport system substrate-binding protein